MPVLSSALPEEVLEAFQTGVDDFLEEDDAIREELAQARIVGVRTFAMRLDEVRRHASPYRGHATGWHVTAVGPEGVLLSGEVVERGGEHRLVRISRDPSTAWITSELENDAVPLEAPEKYDVSLLRIPGVLLEAFAFTPRDGGDAVMVLPVRSRTARSQRSRKLQRPVKLDDFLASLTDSRDGRASLVDRFEKFGSPETPSGSV